MKFEEVLPSLREGKSIESKETKKKYKLGRQYFLDGTLINRGIVFFEWDEEEKKWGRSHYFDEDDFFTVDWEVID
jgi:hypothetical protein